MAKKCEKGSGKGSDPKGRSVKFIPKHQSHDNSKAIAAAVASAVDKKVTATMKSLEQDKTNEGMTEAYIMSLFDKFKTGTGKKAEISDVEVKSILNRAKNSKR
jgi:hypothetical protein